MHEKNKNSLILALTAVGGVAIFATTIGLVTRIRYTGENPRAELENLVSRIQNVAFKSDVFDDSTTYSQIKEQLFDDSGKLLAGTDLNKFISFYTQVNSKLRKFEPTFAPNKPFLEFVDLIPNDNDQSFELRFRAKHQIDNNHTAFSTIISKKVSFAQRSQFALAEFNSNLEKITKSFKENIQNLRRTDFSSNFSSPNLIDQKIASLTRVEDFAADVNKSGTQLEAVEKITQYFPNFQKIINELNFDKNNSFPFKQGTIYNFSLEKHPGTNNFISVDSNSVPSFLVKAELTDDAKFELKNFNIEDAQLLEKIDLVPQVSSGSESNQDANNQGKSDESGEKQAKKATYFADLDDILSKISLRKLNFLDFKVKSEPVQTQAALLTSEGSEIRQLVPVSSDLTQSQTQPQAGESGQQGATEDNSSSTGAGAGETTGTDTGSNGSNTGTAGTDAGSTAAQQPDGATTTEEQPTETPPAKPKDETVEKVKFLEVSNHTINDFFASFNKKIYSSVREKSKEVIEKINSELLIKPISLDFGDFNKYFDKKQPEGVDFYLDLSKAQEKDGVNQENSNLEIPVVINLYSSFFGDSENKLLKSKTSVFEIPNFKKVIAQTGSDIASNLDTERKTFYNLDGLPTVSSQATQVSQPTSVSVSTTANTTPENKKIRIGSTTAYISKTELENLIGQPGTTGEGTEQTDQSKAPKFEEIKKIIGNPFQYAYDFDANESMLKAWVGQQKFPKLEDFASFTENNFIASDYKIKSLKSDKFFKNEYDVASFYAYLIQMEPAQVLNYLFKIAKANGLVDKNASINLNDIKDDNIFKIASDVKFKTTEKVYSLDFNNQFLGFDSRGWISNLFLPKTVWEKTNTLINDSDIFKQLNQYSPVKVETSSGSSSGASTTSSGTSDDLYKTLQENAKKIKENLKKQSSSILKAGADGSSSNGGGSNGGGGGGGAGGSAGTSTTPSSIQVEIKKFFTEKTQPLSTLKDLLLAFYFKAKELTNFNAWSKLGSDLDYKIVFEKQGTTSSSTGGSETLTTPSGLEDYKLTYYYKVFDKKTGVDKYQTPKIDLNLWVNQQDTKKTEKDELNKAVLSIPPSFSLFYLKKEDFDKLKKGESTEDNKKFEETTAFKEIQAKIQENNKDLKLSVVSIDEDKISPQRFKVVNLQIEKTTPTTTEGSTSQSVKSSLSFQVRIALDDTQK
ncbi:P97 family adhesin [Mesomycoplasma ovipneumoniae]|uniref:P97 family adhesin n=1 Tax=Mesomycoplasma ovipneumoniae TaxID=29562 RepID=UPI0039F642B9